MASFKVSWHEYNTSDIINARGKLIEAIIKRGHQVVAIGNEDIENDILYKMGAEVANIKFNRISTSIYQNIKYIYQLSKIMKSMNIDVVLAYTPKPIICGSIAGKIAGVKNRYSLFAGMGYHYSINTPKTVIIRFFCNIGYRIACRLDKKVIVQNNEDKEELVRKKFANEKKIFVVDGSGVDLKRFKKTKNIIESMDKLKFLMISRGLNVKGIKELSNAAEKVHKKYPNVTFTHIGKIEKTYRDITKKEVAEYSKNIEFKGKVENVFEYIKDSNIVILPSYLREGIPRVLLEALAVGRPIITTNTRGCKETVIENMNGYLVKAKDEEDLYDKIIKMIKNPKERIIKMSNESYEIAKKRFDVNKINRRMVEIMELG